MLIEWKWLFKYIKRYSFTIALYIILGLAATAVSLGASVASKFLIDAVVAHTKSELITAAAAVIALSVLKILFTALSSRLASVSGSKANNEIRSDIFAQVLSARLRDKDKFHSGDIINRLEGDANTVSSGIISFIPNVITRLVQFLGALSIVLYYDSTLALFALMSAPILFLSSRYLLKTIRKYSKKSRELNGEVITFSEEAVQNVQTIKAFDLTKQYIGSFDAMLGQYRNVKLAYDKFSIIMTLCLSLIGLVVSYTCYGWGIYRLWQGAISFGTMTLFLQLSSTLSGSFGSLASLAPTAVSIATAAGRVKELSDNENETDKDYKKAIEMMKAAEKTGIKLVFNNVSFCYSDQRAVINNASLSFNPGDTIALLGASGEGKTTLFKLILGLILPTFGEIYIENKNGEKIKISDSTRRFCSYVPQDINMFTGSIAYNLRLVKADATDLEIKEVLQKADIWDFVAELENGISTVIGEGGVSFSQGQRQRLAIARALLRSSYVLLLDETTSALDADTEMRVLEQILSGNNTQISIISTHRESVLKYCNKIYKITPDGNVIKV